MFERMKERLPLVRPLFIPLILYIGFAVAATSWLEANPSSAWRYPVALVPLLPGLFLAAGMARAIRQLDELSRKVLVDSLVISFMATFILLLSLGYLGLAGLAQPNGLYLSFFMIVVWFISKLLISRRYE